MKAMRILMVLSVAVTLPADAGSETAREILDRVREINEAREPDDMSQKLEMTLVDSRGGERVRELEIYSKSYPDDTTKSVTFFRSPPEVRGVGFLSWSHPAEEDDQWLYLPALKRVRRITGSTRRQSFQGSDFTYEDLELFDEMPDWTEEDASSALVRKDDTVDGFPATVIDLVPKNDDYEYDSFRIWVHEPDATLRKIEFHQEKREGPLKTLTLSAFRTIGEIPTPHRMTMENHEKGTRTVMEISDVTYDQGLSDDVFTERILERGKVR